MPNTYYNCRICLEDSVEPIVTQCGHLYCWECIYEWNKLKESDEMDCPVCKDVIKMSEIIPIYTSKENHKKRVEGLPERPRPERSRRNTGIFDENRANDGNEGEVQEEDNHANSGNRNYYFNLNLFGPGVRTGHIGGNIDCSLIPPFLVIMVIPILMTITEHVGEALLGVVNRHKQQTYFVDIINKRLNTQLQNDFNLMVDILFNLIVISFFIFIVFLFIMNRKTPEIQADRQADIQAAN